MEEMIETKVCRRCGRELPKGEFYVNNKSKDGLQTYCKDCKKEMSHKYCMSRKHEKGDVAESTMARHSGRLFPVYTNPKLAEFKDRELMLELKARGFRWEYMLEPQRKIMYDKLK